MQVADGERIARIEVVIDRSPVAEFLNGSVFFEDPIGDGGPLSIEKEIMSANQAAGEEVLALGRRIPDGTNADQLAVVVVAVVKALLGGRWLAVPRVLHHCDSNNQIVFEPYESEWGGAAGGLPIVFTGKLPPGNGFRSSRGLDFCLGENARGLLLQGRVEHIAIVHGGTHCLVSALVVAKITFVELVFLCAQRKGECEDESGETEAAHLRHPVGNVAADPAVGEILAPAPVFTRIILGPRNASGRRHRGIFAPSAGAAGCRGGVAPRVV